MMHDDGQGLRGLEALQQITWGEFQVELAPSTQMITFMAHVQRLVLRVPRSTTLRSATSAHGCEVTLSSSLL